MSDVVGDDPAAFAGLGGGPQGPCHSTATWRQVQTGEAEVTRKTRRDLILFQSAWSRWWPPSPLPDKEALKWTTKAPGGGCGPSPSRSLGIGGDLLPRVLPPPLRRRCGAAVLAWAGAAVVAQWLVFFGVARRFAYLRRFIHPSGRG